MKWYDDYFTKAANNKLIAYSYNTPNLYEPLSEFKDSLNLSELPKSIITLMKPTSSIDYYWSGGYSGRVPHNRKVFMENSIKWNFQLLKNLSYSKNPITRFFAIEELIRRRYTETRCSEKYLDWIERCFKEVPDLKTRSGCIGYTENSKNLVYMFSQMEYR